MYGVMAVVSTVNSAVALPGTSVNVPVVLTYSAIRTIPSPVIVGPFTMLLALATHTPMDDTSAPNVSIEAGVTIGVSCSWFWPVANELSLSTTSKSGTDTLTLVPH